MTGERAIEVLGIMKSQMKEFGMTARFEGLREMQETAVDVAVKSLSEIQQYRAIGTVEECREARERQRGKKPEWSPDCEECEKDGTLDCTYKCGSFSTLSSVLVCPNCKKQRVIKEHGHRYCHNCGQSIDWSDTT